LDGATRKEVGAVLSLTERAVEAVRAIVSSAEGVSESGGVRLAADEPGAESGFRLSVVGLPAEDDEVIEAHGARVFLEPRAASLLEAKLLDASVEQNQVSFTLADQT
jgi:iron-sulfur cluster assembly protein